MAAIALVQGPIVQQVNPQVAPAISTTEKIKEFFGRIEGIGTLFTILTGAAIAAMWGVQFGLLAGGIGVLATFFIASCRSEEPPLAPIPAPAPQPPVNDFVDPYEIVMRYEAEIRHLGTLGLPFGEVHDLHQMLYADLRPINLLEVRLESIRNVHYDHADRPNGGNVVAEITPQDGFEVNLATLNGPLRYYVNREGHHVARPVDARNIAPI